MLGDDSSWRGRPPQVWTITVMAVLGAVMCLVSALRPLTSSAPTTLSLVIAGVAAGFATLLWVAGRRIDGVWLHLALLVCIAACTLLVAYSATAEGAMGGAFAYMWMAVYAALFFCRNVARLYLALLAASLAGALLVNAPRGGLIAWLIVVTSSVAAAEMLSLLHGRVRALAITDQLTGVLNRTGLRDVAARQVAITARTGLPLALVLIDLNGFKLVNDRDGHEAGDRLLADLARRWMACLRSSDILARHGGDEFVLLLPGTTRQQADVLLDRLRAASTISWACGVVEVAAGDDLDRCLARADRLMYEHKSRRGVDVPRLPAGHGHAIAGATVG